MEVLRTAVSSLVEFGFVPQAVIADLQDIGNWKSRANAIDSLQKALSDSDKSSVKFTDSKVIVRSANLKVLKRLMTVTWVKLVIEQLSMGMSHPSWRVREEIVNTVIMALLQHKHDSLDYQRAFGVLSSALNDSKDKVKAVALEGMAVLNNRMGSSAFNQLLPRSNIADAQKSAISARLSNPQLPTANLDGIVEHLLSRSNIADAQKSAISARLSNPQLPTANLDGIVEHVAESSPSFGGPAGGDSDLAPRGRPGGLSAAAAGKLPWEVPHPRPRLRTGVDPSVESGIGSMSPVAHRVLSDSHAMGSNSAARRRGGEEPNLSSHHSAEHFGGRGLQSDGRHGSNGIGSDFKVNSNGSVPVRLSRDPVNLFSPAAAHSSGSSGQASGSALLGDPTGSQSKRNSSETRSNYRNPETADTHGGSHDPYAARWDRDHESRDRDHDSGDRDNGHSRDNRDRSIVGPAYGSALSDVAPYSGVQGGRGGHPDRSERNVSGSGNDAGGSAGQYGAVRGGHPDRSDRNVSGSGNDAGGSAGQYGAVRGGHPDRSDRKVSGSGNDAGGSTSWPAASTSHYLAEQRSLQALAQGQQQQQYSSSTSAGAAAQAHLSSGMSHADRQNKHSRDWLAGGSYKSIFNLCPNSLPPPAGSSTSNAIHDSSPLLSDGSFAYPSGSSFSRIDNTPNSPSKAGLLAKLKSRQIEKRSNSAQLPARPDQDSYEPPAGRDASISRRNSHFSDLGGVGQGGMGQSNSSPYPRGLPDTGSSAGLAGAGSFSAASNGVLPKGRLAKINGGVLDGGGGGGTPKGAMGMDSAPGGGLHLPPRRRKVSNQGEGEEEAFGLPKSAMANGHKSPLRAGALARFTANRVPPQSSVSAVASN
eukprot:gene17058-23353_t